MRYGTHVVVSAKFGGEFKMMHTMQKSKKSSLEQFAEQCTHDSLKTFSRSFDAKAGLTLPILSGQGKTKGSLDSNQTEKKESKSQNENSNMFVVHFRKYNTKIS